MLNGIPDSSKSLAESVVVDGFLSTCTGLRVGRVMRPMSSSELDFARDRFDFLYLKLAYDEKNIKAAVEQGFYSVGSSVSLELNGPLIEHSSQAVLIREAECADQTSLIDIAGKCFEYDRFSRDPFLPNSCASAVKVMWVKNFFLGERGNKCLVAEVNNVVVGFLLAVQSKPGEIIIDLIGVDESVRKHGVGYSLVRDLVGDGLSRGSRICVGTQLENYGALQFYLKMGFKVTSIVQVMHCHFD